MQAQQALQNAARTAMQSDDTLPEHADLQQELVQSAPASTAAAKPLALAEPVTSACQVRLRCLHGCTLLQLLRSLASDALKRPSLLTPKTP